MQQHIQTIVQQFFQKENLHEVAEADLQQFAADYPYAIIGQFLLAEKMRHDNSEKFHDQALRTSLYFNNPAWLYWQLQEHQEANLEGLKAAITMIDEPMVESPGNSTASSVKIPAMASGLLSEETLEAARNLKTAEQTAKEEGQNAEAGEKNTTASAVSLAESVSNPPINEIGFDPYHTIDYFASQGIKLKLEELAKDKLGQQLKSFTEWLRSMKRVGPAAINGSLLDDNTQQAIQSIADHSVEGKDIVTEAMAEVWVKQGNYRKAIAIYEKLSLQNPAKSPYFADRIQQLKAL